MREMGERGNGGIYGNYDVGKTKGWGQGIVWMGAYDFFFLTTVHDMMLYAGNDITSLAFLFFPASMSTAELGALGQQHEARGSDSRVLLS